MIGPVWAGVTGTLTVALVALITETAPSRLATCTAEPSGSTDSTDSTDSFSGPLPTPMVTVTVFIAMLITETALL